MSAIKWLIENLEKIKYTGPATELNLINYKSERLKIIEQAKKIELENLKKAYCDGIVLYWHDDNLEELWNEKLKEIEINF